ncbi:protein kinase [Streptomyces sp. NPDC059816]|uniref:protein kinase domain-containing protein n=1 Tax=Streptomyces sp. NPDC059816 TaxID=3346960 RepID=UPI00364F5FFE
MSGGGDTGRRVIDGRFALEARLGGGGMGMVWRARDLVLDRAVALKEVRTSDPDLAEYDPEAARLLRARVLREARALARIEHPNVVTIHHIVDSDGDGGDTPYPWLVMELVTGGSLQDRLGRGPMAPAEAAVLGRELLAALRAAHAVGIQHRDVKPANVLLRPDGRPVLTDFGIAAIRESTVLTATGSIIGTPDFMAPERITGEHGGSASDLWSLAMMLYVAVEGHHPLRRATTLATLAAVLNEELPPPTRAGALTPVLAALLVKDPAARPDPDTMDRMLADAAARDTAYPVHGTVPYGTPPPPAVTGTAQGPATSYRLTPPPGTPQIGTPPTGTPPGNPYAPPHVTAVTTGTGTATGPDTRRRRSRRIAVGASALSTLVLGALLWQFLPRPGDAGDAGADPARSAPTGGGTTTASQPPAAPASDGKPKPKSRDLLTPDGIRFALARLREETGSDRVGALTVYPEHVSATVLLKGSDRKFDRYLYRVDTGVMKLPASGTLPGSDRPVSLRQFDWDVVPGLLKRAEKDLKVAEPTSRYLIVNPPSTAFGTPTNLSVYFADEYGGGYLKADVKGKVISVHPSES